MGLPGPVAPAIVGLVLDREFILDAEGRRKLADRTGTPVDLVMTRAASRAEIQDRIAQLAGLVPGLDGDRVWRWCLAAAVVLAVQRLRRHPPDEASALLLDLAAGSAGGALTTP